MSAIISLVFTTDFAHGVCVCVFMPIKPGYCHIQCLVFHLKLSSLFKTVFWSQHLLYNLFIIYIYFWLMIFDSVSYGFYNFSFFLLNCNNDVLRVCLLFLFRWIILQFWNYCPWSWKSESMSYLDIIKKNLLWKFFFKLSFQDQVWGINSSQWEKWRIFQFSCQLSLRRDNFWFLILFICFHLLKVVQ